MPIKIMFVAADGGDHRNVDGGAQHFSGHLAMLHVCPDPAEFVPLIGDGMPVALVERITARMPVLAAGPRLPAAFTAPNSFKTGGASGPRIANEIS
jgi:hypothetical protein